MPKTGAGEWGDWLWSWFNEYYAAIDTLAMSKAMMPHSIGFDLNGLSSPKHLAGEGSRAKTVVVDPVSSSASALVGRTGSVLPTFRGFLLTSFRINIIALLRFAQVPACLILPEVVFKTMPMEYFPRSQWPSILRACRSKPPCIERSIPCQTCLFL